MKNIKIILFLFALIAFLVSCDQDDESDLTGLDIGGNITLSTTSISEFDVNKDLKFNLLSKSGVTFDEIKVYKGDTEIAEAVIDNGTNSAIFNSSTLGDFNFPDDEDEDEDDKTGVYEINTKSKISNGKTFLNLFTINVLKELTMDDEVASVINADDTEIEISFKTRTDMADLDFVKVFWKKNYDGDFAEDTDFVFNQDNKALVFDQVADMQTKYSLAINDTIYFKFTTQKGTLTDEVITTIGIDEE